MAEVEEFVDLLAGKRDIIKQEFKRLQEYCYLDHTGCAPYPSSLIANCLKDLTENVYSNPHSNSITSKLCSDSIDQVRFKILNHFNTDLNEYSVIFTSGATAALKLVADSFCWSDIIDSDEWQPKEFSNDCGDFVYMEDNHTSVLGMREVVTGNGAKIHCLPYSTATDTFSNGTSYTNFNRFKSNSLFVYSAQCNFSGVKYPLDWIEKVHQNILEGTTGKRSNWYCMLDAATYVSTNKLDLGKYKPDFICISFYKLFGYPTGLGALLVKNTSANVLYKKYYGGGTVLIALSCQSRHVPKPVIHERCAF